MPERLHILVVGSTPRVQEWRAAGHDVTEVAGGRLGAAWRTWRGAGKGADLVVEVTGGGAYSTDLWWWLEAPRLVVADGSDAPGPDDLHGASRAEPLGVREALARSETAKAAGLAAATLGANAIQLVFTVLFTRLLGVTDYGSLAVLVSAFLILLVAGSAVQVAAARETALGNLGDGAQLSGTLSDWARRVALLLAVVTGASILLREPIAHLVGVPEHPWGAAAILPIGVIWLGLCLQRGVLQGLHAYAPVARSLLAEAGGRLGFSLLLVAAGGGVTGAYLGQALAFGATMVWLWFVLRRRLGPPAEHPPHPLSRLFAENWRPMAALALLGALQNIDVIVVKHQLGSPRAGSYAAAAVAAKTFVWVAIGIGLHLLPEATRRAANGLDPRPVLLRALQIAALIAVPALLVFALVPSLVLRLAFGEEYTNAADALVVLGAAMTMLAVTYLTAQYLIALGRTAFVWVLAAIAVVEPLVLFSGDFSLLTFALIVLAVQATATAGLVAIGLAGRRAAA